MKIHTSQTVVRKTKWRTLHIKEELIDLGKLRRENGIAQTFESHCANWHKSCGIRQNQRNPNWITYIKRTCLSQ